VLRRSAAAVLVLFAIAAVPAGAAPPTNLPPTASPRATQALERVKDLFAGGAGQRRAVNPEHGRSATLALRDLRLALPKLTATQRAEAQAFLGRPTDPQGSGNPIAYSVSEQTPRCTVHFCIHWVASTADAPDPADGDSNGRPDWVDQTAATMEDVWAAEVDGMGYREPMADGTRGGNAKLDVYLAELGSQGLYGYCDSDDPNNRWNVWAYCVLDNDYTGFPNTPLANLQVTAAHEFFHAVQFAYDWGEDRWLMEGTAVWMEDELYDAVDDNLQYLTASPIHTPGVPVDQGSMGNRYGAWLFWRYLSESAGPGAADDPTIVRQVWTRADGAAGGMDQYSLQAVKNTLAARGRKLPGAYADFMAWNRVPASRYAEGASYVPYVAQPSSITTLGPNKKSVSGTRTLAHLAASVIAFSPGAAASTGGHLTVSVDMPSASHSPVARVVVKTTAGGVTVHTVTLGSLGNGSVRVAFGRGTVSRVELVLVNGASGYTCWRGTTYSCMGKPLDDGRSSTFQARLS
jgi:hypothetical protein